MKKLLLSAAFAAVLATPALAQSYNPDYGTGNVNPPVASEQSQYDGNAFAYAPRETRTLHARRALRSNNAYQDPNIALQQRRDDSEY